MKRLWPYRELAFQIQEAESLLKDVEHRESYKIAKRVISEIDCLSSKGILNNTVTRAAQTLYNDIERLKRTLNL